MDVSIIIPCYNSGKYLPDAVNSVKNLEGRDQYNIELIVVNDGSTDPNTLQLLSEIEQQNVKVVHRENGGPAAARNTGVNNSTGYYLIFLDSDNTLKPPYVKECISQAEKTKADIIYTLSDFFGDSTIPRFTTGQFDLHRILVQNYIDMCCLIKRECFDRVGQLDENRSILGFEDWEFYLRAYSKGLRFHYIETALYSYRVLQNSLSQTHTGERMRLVKEYVYGKNIGLLIESINFHHHREKMRLDSRKNKMRWMSDVFQRYLISGKNKVSASAISLWKKH